MYEYVHGGDIYALQKSIKETILDFSVNVNPLGLPSEVKRVLAEAVSDCETYPDPFCRELTAALGEYENTQPDFILCGNGASDIIFRLALALKPKKALLCAPTFADYEKALKTVDCEVNYYYLSERVDFDLGMDFLDLITPEIDIIYLCNPNNPTGQLCPQSLMQDVIKRCKETGTTVMVDECFLDFTDDTQAYSAQALLHSYPNLVILKAFTKVYAMAGIRLGYCITSNTGLIDKMRACGQDWGVSSLAQAAGITALKQMDYIQETKRLIREEREYLIRELSQFKIKVYGSKANYIFFRAQGVADLDKRLLARGIYIRSCRNYVNLDSRYYRLAVRKHSDNLKLIQALKEVMG